MEKNNSEIGERLMVMRPDVSRSGIDRGVSPVVVETGPDRLAAEVALDALYIEVQARGTRTPEWYDYLD